MTHIETFVKGGLYTPAMHEMIVKTGGTLYESLFYLHNANDGLFTMGLLEQIKIYDTDFNVEDYLSKPPEDGKYVDPKIKQEQLRILN